MTLERVDYFEDADGFELNDAQRQVVSGVRKLIDEIRPRHLEPSGATAAMLADDELWLELRHSDKSDVQISIAVDCDGKLAILCDALHPTFELCFNDIWEPHDCIGELPLGIEVVGAMLDGRVESEVLWGGDGVARSKDFLLKPDGARVLLFTQYHGPALLHSILERRRETTRVSFR